MATVSHAASHLHAATDNTVRTQVWRDIWNVHFNIMNNVQVLSKVKGFHVTMLPYDWPSALCQAAPLIITDLVPLVSAMADC